MIATLPLHVRLVAQSGREVLRVSDVLRDEAALVYAAALGDVSGKKVDRAAVPNAGKFAHSRSLNGGDSNPLYRIAMLFVLMKRCGLSRARAQRVVDWTQELVNAIWGEESCEDFEAVMDKEQELDALDDGPQLRAVRGDVGAMREMLDVKREQHALDATVILALRRRIAAEG